MNFATIKSFFCILLWACTGLCDSKVGTKTKPTEHIQVGCALYSTEKKLIQKYPGTLCLFLQDGRFVSSRENEIVMYKPNLQIAWTLPIQAHHQINLSLDKKNILVIGSEVISLEKDEKFRSDVLYILSLEGKILKTFSLYKNKEQFQKDRYKAAFDRKFNDLIKADRNRFKNIDWELTHVNSFYEIPDNTLSSEASWLKKGHYVVNDISMMLVFVLDSHLQNVVWQSALSKESWTMYHDVQVLTNGHMLIYDNGTRTRPFSRLIEIHPLTEKIIWEYKGSDKNPFYSKLWGGLQKLNNQNFLYTETTDPYYVREITPQGQTVWELPIEKNTYLQQAKKNDFSLFLEINRGF